MKKIYLLMLLIIILVGIVTFIISPTSIKGISTDGMWKVVYKKINEVEAGNAWKVSVTQLNDKEVIVKKLEFLENDKGISDRTEFYEGRDIDGTEYTLHPFSYPDLYYGEEPKKNASYSVVIIWTDAQGKTYDEKIELK